MAKARKTKATRSKPKTKKTGAKKTTAKARPKSKSKKSKSSSKSKLSWEFWSKKVTKKVKKTADTLTLEAGVFTKSTGKAIAASLARSVKRSERPAKEAYRSAVAMLDFYTKRAGKTLSVARKKTLAEAKRELRALANKL